MAHQPSTQVYPQVYSIHLPLALQTSEPRNFRLETRTFPGRPLSRAFHWPRPTASMGSPNHQLQSVSLHLSKKQRRTRSHGSLNVPIEHHPTIRYMVYNGYYKVMSNIPKMGHLTTPALHLSKSNGVKTVVYTQRRHRKCPVPVPVAQAVRTATLSSSSPEPPDGMSPTRV